MRASWRASQYVLSALREAVSVQRGDRFAIGHELWEVVALTEGGVHVYARRCSRATVPGRKLFGEPMLATVSLVEESKVSV